MKKNKVKLITLALASTFLISGIAYGNSSKRNVTTTIDEGITMKWNNARFTARENNGSAVHPIVYNGRTYLPIRFIAEKAGVDVDWDNTTKTVIFNQSVNNENTNKNISKNTELETQLKKLQDENKRLESQVKKLNNEIENFKNIEKKQQDQQKLDRELELKQKADERELQYKQQELERELESEKKKKEAEERLRKLKEQNRKPHSYIDGTGQETFR